MIIIKIDPKTVHKNPRAGCTTTKVFGNQTCTFEFKEDGQIPPHLLQHCDIMQTDLEGLHQSGYIIDPDEVEKFFTIPGISIECKREIQVIQHMPFSEWLYGYEDSLIQCNYCRNPIQYKDLEIHNYYQQNEDEDEMPYTKCPSCGEIDTFEYEYEKIEEYFKRNNL